jgi:hypothetical protein
MGQGVRERAEVLKKGASGAGKPAGGAATGPTAVRARAEGGLPATGTEVPSGGPDVPATTTLRQHRRLGVKGGIQSAPGGGQRADGLAGCGGTLFKEHLENCAPCHNPNIDLIVDPTLTSVRANHFCQVCRSPGDPERMLLCGYCLEGWHMGCLEPALTSVPAGIWLCPHCVEAERARQE